MMIASLIVMMFFAILLLHVCARPDAGPPKRVKDVAVYLINLDRRPDRGEKLRQLYLRSDLGEVLQRVPAIDGKKLDMSQIQITDTALADVNRSKGSRGYRTEHHQLTPGAVGCYLSHVKAWQEIAHGDKEYALILEDDAQLPPTIGNRMLSLSEAVPQDWDMLLFGYVLHRSSKKYPRYTDVTRFFQLHCYLVTRECAKKMLQLPGLFPMSQQIDWQISDWSEKGLLNIYATPEQHCKPLWGDTDIQIKIKKNG